ncbi:ABC-2 transporter permease [Blautia schinkii]|nr:ABC-2 transporter permease [Blautia schinkii]
MKGLIRVEYYMIKAEIWTYLKMFGLFAVFSLFVKSSLYIMTMQFVTSVMLLLSMMTVDENGKDAYYQQLPFDRRELVKEKYVRGCVFLIPLMLLADFIGFMITLIYGLDLVQFLSNMVLGIVYFLLTIDIVIPIAIKRGAGKSRFICIFCVVLPPAALIFPINAFMKGRPGINADLAATILMLIVVVLVLLLLPISYKLSVKFYQAKEF